MVKIQLRFYLNDQRDADLLAWLERQPNRSLAVRKALQAWISQEQGLDEQMLRRVLREELAQVTIQGVASAVPEIGQEDDKVAEALDALMNTWTGLGEDGE